MRKPFSLTAYLALSRGQDRLADAAKDWADRPSGPVIWLHSDTRLRMETLFTLIQRLGMHRNDFALVLTSDAAEQGVFDVGVHRVMPPPAETSTDIDRFLEHWQPDILIWAGNRLRPALLHQVSERDIHMMLVDAADAPWQQPTLGWLPDTTRSALSLFHQIVAQDESAARRLRKLGVPDSHIDVAAPLEPEIFPLSSHDGLHEELSAVLAGRPVWLAAKILLEEADTVLRAHRRATRLAHRLLLIVVPANADDEPAIAEVAHEIGLRLARWEHGDTPDENAQVLLAGDDAELGLWYRLAPLCFLGGSLAGSSGGQSPMMAAAFGSAVLYGPQVGQHLEAYSRLVSAGAARIVKDMESLSAAVTHLIAPDRVATMAHAGWTVVSSGAETADLVLTQINEWLDAFEARP